jgi:MFS family permease
MASPRSLRGLDWLNFFVANAQTGFGPFIAVYLTTQAWTQVEIGEVLSLGTVTAMLSQLPGGAAVDRLRNKRLAAGAAGIAIVVSALLFAVAPTRPAVGLAEVLHSCASSMLGPAIAAISLTLVGRAGLGERLGRNARFASLGNGIAAAALGACGSYISSRAVFWLTAALMLPALFALRAIGPEASQPHASQRGETQREEALAPQETGSQRRQAGIRGVLGDVASLLTNPGVLAFASCAALFQLANAAILPLVGSELTRATGDKANMLIAACIVLPQILVALVSPWVGRTADRTGFRLVLALGFAALPARALLLASVIDNPVPLVAVQTLDGLSAAVFGVMLPLVAAELTRGTERFNLCIGVLGLAVAGGATLSTLLSGLVADHFGARTALVALAGCGAVAVLAVLTVPQPKKTASKSPAGG